MHEGKRPGGRMPYGYDKDGNIIEKEAQVIREIRKQFMSGVGYKTISLTLNRSNRLRRGKEWRQSTVSYTLENPFYAGIIRFGTKNQDGKYVNSKRSERVECIYSDSDHAAIWTKDEYDEHIEMIKRKSFGGYSQIKEYWFSGVLRCGKCGSAMFGRMVSKAKRTQYYICSRKHDGRDCDMPTFRQAHVEHLLMREMESKFADAADLKDESERLRKMESKKNDHDQLRSQLVKIKERRRKWQYLFAEGMMTSDELRERLKSDEREEKTIQSQLEETLPIIRVAELKSFLDFWHIADDLEKKKLVQTTFSRLVLKTDLTHVKGVKNKFFDASLEVEYQ